MGTSAQREPSATSQRFRQAYEAIMREDHQRHIATQPFRLLDLPPEIHNAIYRLAVVAETPIALKSRFYYHSISGRPRGEEIYIPRPNLLFASRQLQAEASSIFYAENTSKVAPTFTLGKMEWGQAAAVLHNMARHKELRAIERIQVTPPPRYGSDGIARSRAFIDWREELDADLAQWAAGVEYLVQQWFKIEGWRHKFCTVPKDCCRTKLWLDMGSCECGKWVLDGYKDGKWNYEVEKRTREVAGRVFRFPMRVEGEETTWVTLAEVGEF